MDLIFHRWRQSEYDLEPGEVYPEFPGLVVLTHVMWRSTGALMAISAVGAPVLQLVRGKPIFGRTTARLIKGGTLLGAAAGIGATISVFSKTNAEGVEDRAYRLLNNTQQNLIDDYLFVGSTAGAIVGSVALAQPILGFGAGLAVGAVGAALEAYVVPKSAPEVKESLVQTRAYLSPTFFVKRAPPTERAE